MNLQTKILQKFCVGWDFPDQVVRTFPSEEDAAFGSEEWVVIYAETEEEAIARFEPDFLAWQQSEANHLNKL